MVKKNYPILIFFSVLFFFLSCNLFFLNSNIQAEELEISFAHLIILTEKEILKEDYFFQVLDKEDHILVPLMAFAERVGLDGEKLRLEYVEQYSILLFFDGELPDPGPEFYPELSRWGIEPFIIFDEDVFVSTGPIEALTGLKISWDPESRELKIDTTDLKPEYWTIEMEDLVEPRPPVIEIKPEIVGPAFSLGSIQYKIGVEYKYVDETEQDITLEQIVYTHGRIGDLAYSIGEKGSYVFEKGDFEFSFPLFRLRYTEDDQIIVLGDTRVFMPATLGRQSLRGFFFQFPQWQVSRVRSFTSVSGEAQPGDMVTLFVNDRRIAQTFVYRGERDYKFENVPLVTNRVNTIRVEVKSITGQITEMEKTIPGSPDILEEGTWEYMIFAGRYGGSDGQDFKGNIAGQEIRWAVTDRVSATWELAGKHEFSSSDEPNPVEVGSVLGLSFWAGDLPLVLSADWLVGGEWEELGQGARASGLYALKEGYLEAVFSYVPPEVAVGIRETEGALFETGFNYTLSPLWNLSLGGEIFRPVGDMDPYTEERVEATVTYRDGRRLTLSTTGALGHRFFIDKDSAGQERDNHIIDMELILEQRSFLSWGSTRNKLTLLGGYLYPGEETPYLLSGVLLDLGFSWNAADSVLVAGGGSASAYWAGTEFEGSEAKGNIRMRIAAGENLVITGTASLEGDDNQDNGTLFEAEKAEVGFSSTYYFSRIFHTTGELKYTWLLPEVDQYYSGRLSLFYNNPDLNLRLSLRGDYLSPTERREVPQFRASTSLTYFLPSGMGVSFDAARTYSSATATEPIYTLGVSISQTLGFTRDKIFGQRLPTGTDHVSFIAGVVYLDENGNGLRDRNDPVLQDITILLDRRRTRTDEDGGFFFERLGPGLYEVSIDPGQLPPEYQVSTPKKVIQLRENENIYLEFGVIRTE